MYVVKVKDYDVIFDDESTYKMITTPIDLRVPGQRSMWVDNSSFTPYATIWLSKKNVRVHHLIIGTPLNGLMVDHLNGNSLDNSRHNLKVVSRAENVLNRPSRGKHKRWVIQQRNGKFQAQVRIGLGTYDTEEEAHKVALDFIMKRNKDLYIHESFL